LLTALDTLQAIFRRLAAKRDLEYLYATAVQEAAAFFNVAQCVLLLYDPSSGTMRVQPPAVGLNEAQTEALSAVPAAHIEQVINNWPVHGVLRLLAPEYARFVVPALVEQLDERDVLLALMRTEGQVIGELRLANKCDGTVFSQEEIHLLGLYASQLGLLIHGLRVMLENQRLYSAERAVALENARLFEQTRRHLQQAEQRSQELALINRISDNLSASLDLDEVLRSTVTELATTLGVEQCGLVLFDWTQGYGRLVAEYQRRPDETGRDVRIPVAGNLSLARVLETKAPLAIRDAQNDLLLANVREIIVRRGIKSILLLPLVVRGEVIGTIGLDELRAMRDFTPAEVELAQTITNQAASAIANARLYEDVKRRAVQLQTIQEVTGRISAILDPGELLAQVAGLLVSRFGYYHVEVFLVDESGEYLVGRVGCNVAGRQHASEGVRLRIGAEGICGWATGTGQTALVNDVSADPHYVPHPALPETRSELAVPIKLGGRVVGVLNVESDRVGAFDEGDRFLLETLADQVAIALENAHLYATVQERARQLAAANEELKTYDRMKDEFVQTVSHELRTPLTFIKGYVELLLERVMGELNQEQVDALQIVAQRTESIVHLVNDIISLTRSELPSLQLQVLDLREVALLAVQAARAVTERAGLRLTTDFPDSLPEVMGDSQRLSQVFDNLIGNAVKFSPDGGTICVRLRAEEGTVRAEVSDQGIGIPADKLERVWERFYQVDGTTTRRFSGTGLGLAIVKRLIEAHGGQVGAESTVGHGSTFWFAVPRADG
jgi:signal transduction histidine kinase